jgi:Outer membrane protein
MKLKNLIYISSILLIFFNSDVSKAENIAFIDLNKIFDSSEAGKKIIKQVKDKQKKNLDELKKMQKKFDTDKEKIIAQKNVLSEEDFKSKIIKLENDFKEYNQKVRENNSSLTNFQLKARGEFYNYLTPILESYAKENSISLILKRENILIGKTNLDISQNILEIFNKKIKTIKVN